MEHYESLTRIYKRPPPPMRRGEFKDELESMEETDTEKRFKKINTCIVKGPIKYAYRNYSNPAMDIENKSNSADQIEKYKKVYEMEKLRYAEERSKYLY